MSDQAASLEVPQTELPGIERIVDKLARLEGRDDVRVEDMVKVFGSATFVPFLIIPAILIVSPLSGIPFFSTICGVTIALVAAQMVVRRKHLWLPGWLMKMSISGEALKGALRPVRRIACFIDDHSEPKYRFLNRPPFDLLPAVLCVAAGLVMPMLEVVPFSSSALGLSVLCFSVGFLARDGRFTLAGIGIMAIALATPLAVVTALAN